MPLSRLAMKSEYRVSCVAGKKLVLCRALCSCSRSSSDDDLCISSNKKRRDMGALQTLRDARSARSVWTAASSAAFCCGCVRWPIKAALPCRRDAHATLPFCSEIRVSCVEGKKLMLCRALCSCSVLVLMLLALVLGRCLMIDLCILPTKSAGIRAHSKRSATPDPREAYGLRRLPPLSVVFVFVGR